MIKISLFTKQEYRSQGDSMLIDYGFADSPFGRCFIAKNEKGVCDLQFVDQPEDEIISALLSDWRLSTCRRNDSVMVTIAETIFSPKEAPHISVCLRGTPFQLAVWQILVTIPYGSVVSYSELARMANHPTAVRAVASAVARNRISIIIPCHRVVRADGSLGQFRWGSTRKADIIRHEKSNLKK